MSLVFSTDENLMKCSNCEWFALPEEKNKAGWCLNCQEGKTFNTEELKRGGLILQKGDKVRVIDAMIFPESILEGCTGWVTFKDKKFTGYMWIAFYPNGNKTNVKIANKTKLDSYLKKVS